LKADLTALAFARPGRLVAALNDGTAQCWDVDGDNATRHDLQAREMWITALAFTADGRLVSAGRDHQARVWDLSTRASTPLVLRGHQGVIEALTVAPDGRIVTGGGLDDRTVRVWDPMDPTAQSLVLRGHEQAITSMAFAPDRRLVTGSRDQTIRVWELDLDKLRSMAGDLVSRNLNDAEWQQFFPREPYHRTFCHLPDGPGVAEGRRARSGMGSAMASAPTPGRP
jgi:WD40 repeat protein